jgi:hypothetical protein
MRTPDYRTTEDFNLGTGMDPKILPAGSFVRPVDLKWVPKHLVESPDHRFFNEEREVFAYCRFGFIVIPKRLLRKT